MANLTSLPFPQSSLQKILNMIGFPLRTVLLRESWVERIGLTSLQQERINAVWPYLKGRVLDIGAGNNRLIRLYENGIGVEVYDWKGGAMLVNDTAHLPFQNAEFDTVCLIACLNHIPNRGDVLKEAYRILKPGGTCLITMINPWIGFVNHKLCWYEESHERGMEEGEKDGLWKSEIYDLLHQAGFTHPQDRPFLYRLNCLYVATK
jgi:SAM-dependent methyltransferase